jgi:hypothetical protein
MQRGINTLMLRLCLHYGTFSTTGGIKYESAREFWAGLWQISPTGQTPLVFEEVSM